MSARLFIIASLLFLTASPLCAQVSTVSVDESRRGGSTIRGRVIYEDNEKPARRVGVALLSVSNPNGRSLDVTDAKGEFVFKNVADGTYRAVADFAGYTNGFPMSELVASDGVEVVVSGGSSHDIKLRAIRGAAITGKVTYPDGEPVIGAQVNIYRKTRTSWVHAAIATGGTETDDRGIFRLYPLRAGEYAVSVTERSLTVRETAYGVSQSVENKSLNPYFYQEAASLQSATIIQVEAGLESGNINITLSERPGFEISGTILVNQKPLPNVSLRLDVNDNLGGPTLMRPHGTVTKADSDGNFVFKNVPEGIYNIQLDYMSSSRENYQRFLWQQQQITLAGADLSGIVINLQEAGRVSGSVVVEGGKPLPRRLSISAMLVGGGRPSHFSTNMELTKQGTFMIGGLTPGDNNISFDTDEGYFVKSLTQRGRDLLRQPLKIEGGSEVSGVTVVLSAEVGSLSGKLLTPQRKPLDMLRFALFPVDESKWPGGSGVGFRGGVSGTSDLAGAFKVSGPPGEYYFVVLNRPIESIEALKDLARRSQRVQLRVGQFPEIEVIVP